MKHIKPHLLWVFLLASFQLTHAGGESSVQTIVLPPVDESGQVPDLALFLKKLRKAVTERDAQFLQTDLAEDTRLGFGPNKDGTDPAASTLPEADSQLWQRLESSVFLGGTFISTGEGAKFCMPYIYSAFPDHIDPLEHQVIIEPSIEARVTPSGTGAEISLPDYAIVRTDLGSAVITKGGDGRQWARIYLDDESAYVPADVLRSPLDSRTCLEKREGQWRISDIVAGG